MARTDRRLARAVTPPPYHCPHGCCLWPEDREHGHLFDAAVCLDCRAVKELSDRKAAKKRDRIR